MSHAGKSLSKAISIVNGPCELLTRVWRVWKDVEDGLLQILSPAQTGCFSPWPLLLLGGIYTALKVIGTFENYACLSVGVEFRAR